MADSVVKYSTHVLGTIGISANVLLIVMIVQCTPPYLNGYSKLLLASAICDICGLVAAVATCATEVAFDWTCFIKYAGFCTNFGLESCALLFGIQCEMYSTSVMLMCFSFFYRYCLLEQISSNTLKMMRSVIIFAIFIINTPLAYMFHGVILNGANKSELIEQFREAHETSSPIIGVTYFRDSDGLLLLIFTFSSSVLPFVSSIFLRRITIKRTNEHSNSMSQSTRQMHKILVNVLNTQLVLVAIFFVGCTLFVIDLLEFPYLPNTSIISVPLCNLQNVCPPIANLYIIIPYRRRLSEIFAMKNSKQIVIAPQDTAFTHSTINDQ